MNWIIYRPVDQTVVGPFRSEAEAYVWADRVWGELNADEFDVFICNPPNEQEESETA